MNTEIPILLANPRGFCAGVDRAIDIVQRALEIFGRPIYARHEVVHNQFVVERLRQQGACFVDDLDEVPCGSTVVFSAHGVAPTVWEVAKQRQLKVLDATCPLVTKVHLELISHARKGRAVILIGHAGHPEVIGTLGQFDAQYGGSIHLVENITDVESLSFSQEQGLAYVTQTTLSVDDTAAIIAALKSRWPHIIGPAKNDICYATQNRQQAVRALARQCDLLIIIGSANSSNSNRLREIAERANVESYLLQSRHDIKDQWLTNKTSIGVSAGASAPEELVQEVVAELCRRGAGPVKELTGTIEKVSFSLPPALRRTPAPT